MISALTHRKVLRVTPLAVLTRSACSAALLLFEPFTRFAPQGCEYCGVNGVHPQLVSAQFDNSGASLNLVFDRVTNEAAKNCSALLAPTTISALGTGATCIWQDNVTVLFGTGASLMPGDAFAIAANTKVASATAASAHAIGSLPVCAPASPLQPVAVLTVPTIVELCDDLVLDARSS